MATTMGATHKVDPVLVSKLLNEFTSIPSLDKAWTFRSVDGKSSEVMFSVSQANLLANNRRKFIMSAHIMKEDKNSIKFQWSRFPIEMTGVSEMVPSPSGSRLLVIRNPENESATQFEIWDDSQLIKEIRVPQSIHGSVYVDKWFEGISWNSDELLIAYIAEQPPSSKPVFDSQGFKKDGSVDNDSAAWKGQGEWEEDWGESYAGKRQPALFVLNINSGEVKAVTGIPDTLSVGQVVWAPRAEGSSQLLVVVGWISEPRKLGIKYGYNRPCALYAVQSPVFDSKVGQAGLISDSVEDFLAFNLTPSINSAYFPIFSPDGKYLIFLSSKSAVDTGAHCATNSLHRIDWGTDIIDFSSIKIVDVVPVVQDAEEGCFPGLYCSLIHQPWLSDSHTLILTSHWGSTEAILSVNVLTNEVMPITPVDSVSSWKMITLDGDGIIAVSSSLVNVPRIEYGYLADKTSAWSWIPVSSPIFKCSDNILSLLASQNLKIVKIPVRNVYDNHSRGASQPYEAMLVSNGEKNGHSNPLIVVLHGGPHSVYPSGFSKSLAFLSSLGYNLLIVNYRGSLGFGEEALQSLLGNVGSQDVDDILAAIDHVTNAKLVNPSGIALLGGSHGGFLTTHLIGQAPDRFFAAAARNPVCNLALMVGTTDIPDWCFCETYGLRGKEHFTEAPSSETLSRFLNASPISHISKVKTPTLFLIGAQDLRVPMSNGIQYARALKERGVDVKIVVFPRDVHAIERPQSDFESFLNIGLWFNKYCP